MLLSIIGEKSALYLLEKKIQSRLAHVGIVGLGYVGLPLLIANREAGYKVTGFDSDIQKINYLSSGKSYLTSISENEVAKLSHDKKVSFTNQMDLLTECDIIVLCIPTPLDSKTHTPDLSYLEGAVNEVKGRLRYGQAVVLESTTYPGTTREVILNSFAGSKLEVGRDYFLAFSPERVDPGNKEFVTTNIPKLIGGLTETCSHVISTYYNSVLEKTIIVSRPEVAEMAKILENTYRLVNISLINEMSNVCHELNIDIWEVIEASGTKPFGFQKFYPGPGIGGHCIPVDPLYFKWLANQKGLNTEMIDIAHKVNQERPKVLAGRAIELIKAGEGQTKKILIIGSAYKKDINDYRESSILNLIKELQENEKVDIQYYDPFIDEITLLDGTKMQSVEMTVNMLKLSDIVIIHTDHSHIDYNLITENSRLILDCRNVLREQGLYGEHIHIL